MVSDHAYPGTKDKQELMDHAFSHGLIPAMKDEMDKMREEKKNSSWLATMREKLIRTPRINLNQSYQS